MQVGEVAAARQLVGPYPVIALGACIDRYADLDLDRPAVAVQLAEQDELGAGGLDAVPREPREQLAEGAVDEGGHVVLDAAGDPEVRLGGPLLDLRFAHRSF
jgi:hypothetical protein